ncbi:hypothetical protein GC102_06490 [Paenibacillus sp. LMG 31460]|uniref:Carbohydrate-binding domain-containing protein n=1 Tax=Paenibacillus germinis TaxID=2654979 RepID=A0ABX1Z073_9BACL|nr:hypothetical protein [Paenibacillus germinis]NOU85426.1 hypothetical protein [Paenibacillus germinis]
MKPACGSKKKTEVNVKMKVLTRVLLVTLLFGLLFPTSAYPQSLRYEDMPLANPGFEVTTVLGGQRVPVSWTSSLWGRTTPAVTGVSDADVSSGMYSLYVMSVDQGSAGWTSGFLSVTEDVYEIKGSFKARKTTDYSGNVPWVFLSFWQDGTYLGTSTVAVTAGTAGWSPNSFQVNAGQFPSGTNKVRINLATSRVGQSGAIAGSVRYDDVVIQTGTLSDVIDIANPGFEQTYVSQGKLLPLNWTSALWNRTIPVDTAVTNTVYAQGNHSLYMAAADAGSAGWASQPIAVYGSPQSIKLTFDIKKSSNYVGNVAWAFISFWNNSTFIGTATVPVSGLSEAWSEQSLTLKGAQFPQGTNYMRINLATTRGGASGTLGGTLYYDNVQMKTVDDFSLTSSAFANWYKLGEDVVFKPENQLLPQSVHTVTGTVYDEEGQVIAQSTVNRQTLLSDGWSWEPERAGYYEIAFDYVKTGDTTPVAHTEAYTVTSAKGTAGQFVRDRYAVAVADGDTKAMSQRSPMFGFSYQLEGEQAVQLADTIGFSMARIHSVPWGTQFTNTAMALEPSRGTYNWTAFDAQVNMLRSYGFELAGNILFTPQWASSHPEDTQIYTAVPGYAAYAPADMEDLADFLRALIDRYGDRISKWEVWNEPHLPGGSIFWRDTPEKFVELLQTSYETIKEEQPESEVWIGGLGGRRYLPFYRELLRLGATSYYDKLALHGAFPNADYFKDLDDQYEAASKDWVTSESHAGLISSIGLTAVPSEKEIAFKILLDYLYQIKHGAEQIAYFEMMNQVETEALTFAKADGWHTHASGLFRKKPQIEPRLGAVALHRFLETAGQTVSYRGEYALSSVQNAVYLDNGGTPLTVLWLSGENEQVIDSRLTDAFTLQTKIRDWTGRSYSASASLVLKPGRMYYIEQLDKDKLGELPLSDEVLLSDYDKVRRNATIPVGAGQAGELFDHETGELRTEPITWIENDWVFDSETGQTRPAGLDAKFAVGYTEDGIDLTVDVADAVFVQNESTGLYWRGDSLQFAIDTYGLGAPAEARMDFQAALTAEGPKLWKETTPYIGGDLPYNWTQQQQFVQHGQIHIDRTGTQTLYKIHLDWSELYPYVPQAGVPIYLSVLVNTNDGAGRIGWLEWGSGIGKSKDPSLYGKITLN